MTEWSEKMKEKGMTAQNCQECKYDKVCKCCYGGQICTPIKKEK